MADNVDVLKQAYEAFSKGDAEGALEAFADDAVWRGTQSTELPGGGEVTGKEEIGRAMGAFAEAYDEFTLVPDEFYESGDNVVVLLHSEAKKDDRTAELPAVHVLRFEDGKVTRFHFVTDSLLAAETLGLIGGQPPEEDDGGDHEKVTDDDDDGDDDHEKVTEDDDDGDEKDGDDDHEKVTEDDGDEKSEKDDD